MRTNLPHARTAAAPRGAASRRRLVALLVAEAVLISLLALWLAGRLAS